ncbi:hypothetical protein GCM10023149_23720 [Mucilaginibacter gynuensis]|uniref:Uncharacterized protein n=1 Tax=Mucilaginibacter gynuensis TaxID=1302236 RepID=A0ABP8GET8_9SPHI
MHGISKARHKHLIDALLGMENLLNEKQSECEHAQQTAEYRAELEEMYTEYEDLLSKLSVIIVDYEILYSHVKINYLAKKLRELKKEIPADDNSCKPSSNLLRENIRLAYAT